MSRQLTKEHKILIGAAVVLAALVTVFAIVVRRDPAGNAKRRKNHHL